MKLVVLVLLLLLTAVARAQQPSNASDDPWDDEGNINKYVSPSLAIVVIVLVIAFFTIGCISIYIQQCAMSTSSPTVAPIVSSSQRGINANRGLNQSVIDTFPTFEYSAVKEHRIGKGSLECAVCLSEFEENETLRLIPKCDHVFHAECIDTWLVGHVTCPVCRADLSKEPSGSGLNTPSGTDQTDETSSSDVQITIHEDETRDDVVVSNHAKLRTLPRSHSTGHSLILVQPGENCERFTLRLPADVRRQLLARVKFQRATSMVTLPRQSSSRRGYRSGGGEGSGSSRYGRYFGRSFISRLGSFKSTSFKVGSIDRDIKTACTGSMCSWPAVTPSLENLPPRVPV